MFTTKKKIALFLYLYIGLLLSTSLSYAAQFESDEHVHISNIHNIDGDLYTWGEKVTIDGVITGDLHSGYANTSINGVIENSANIIAKRFIHNGEINGSLRVFAEDATIDGSVDRSVLLFCGELLIGKNAEIGKDANIYGASITIDGVIHGDVTIHSGGSEIISSGVSSIKENVYISGTIDGDLTVYGKNIHIIAPALIKGNFRYISENQVDMDISSGVTILGTHTWDLPDNTEKEESESLFLTTVKTVSRFFATFLFGLLLMVLCKNYISSMVFQLKEKFAITAAVGFISLALLVIFVIILIFTVIMLVTGLALISKGDVTSGTIIVALSSIFGPISTVTITTLGIMIYSGKIVVALFIGSTIISKLKSNPKYLSISQFFLGLAITYILFAVPYIGTLLFWIISLIGVGAIILGLKNCNKGLDKTKMISDQAGI